jgi:arylformamidase
MENKKVFLLSHTMSEQTPLYGGEKSISLKHARSIKRGDSCNTMHWSFPNHVGTHVDVPLHFMEQGSSIADFEPGEWVFNRVSLVEIPDTKPGHIIKAEDLGDVGDCELLLIKTGFEKYRVEKIYWQDSPGLHPGIVPWLKGKSPSIKAVGIDFISVSNLNDRELGREAHRSFLKSNILLIEDMKLSGLVKAPRGVIVAPLIAERADGAPCTVFGMEE